jgi:osmotically-inducible protein OsmY
MSMCPAAALSPMKEGDRFLSQQVRQILQRTGYAALQSVECRVENGIVRLCGEVPSFYCKQLAQEVLLTLKPVAQVENCLRVQVST